MLLCWRVLLCSFGVTHIVRVEDFPVMPVEVTGECMNGVGWRHATAVMSAQYALQLQQPQVAECVEHSGVRYGSLLGGMPAAANFTDFTGHASCDRRSRHMQCSLSPAPKQIAHQLKLLTKKTSQNCIHAIYIGVPSHALDACASAPCCCCCSRCRLHTQAVWLLQQQPWPGHPPRQERSQQDAQRQRRCGRSHKRRCTRRHERRMLWQAISWSAEDTCAGSLCSGGSATVFSRAS